LWIIFLKHFSGTARISIPTQMIPWGMDGWKPALPDYRRPLTEHCSAEGVVGNNTVACSRPLVWRRSGHDADRQPSNTGPPWCRARAARNRSGKYRQSPREATGIAVCTAEAGSGAATDNTLKHGPRGHRRTPAV